MFNEGRWNSDLAIFYVLVFFSPIVLYFLAGFLLRISQLFEKNEKIVYIEKPVYREVVKYVDRPAQSRRPTNSVNVKSDSYAQPKNSVRSVEVSKQKTERPVQKKENKPNQIIKNAIFALVGTGFKKAQAKRIIDDLAQNKQYTNVADLIKDAFTKK